MAYTQHPMTIPAGTSSHDRTIIAVRPTNKPLTPVPGKNKDGKPFSSGRVTLIDADTHQFVNYETNTKDGNDSHRVGCFQSKKFLDALNDALTGPAAVHYTHDPGTEGVLMVAIKADVDVGNDKGHRSMPHLIQQVPEGGFETVKLKDHVYKEALRDSARYRVLDRNAGQLYNLAKRVGYDEKTAAHIVETTRATYLHEKGMTYINAPKDPDVQAILNGTAKGTPMGDVFRQLRDLERKQRETSKAAEAAQPAASSGPREIGIPAPSQAPASTGPREIGIPAPPQAPAAGPREIGTPAPAQPTAGPREIGVPAPTATVPPVAPAVSDAPAAYDPDAQYAPTVPDATPAPAPATSAASDPVGDLADQSDLLEASEADGLEEPQLD